MDIEKFTDRVRGFIQAAQTIAIRDFHQQLTPEHLLKALLDDEEGAAAGLIRAAGADDRAARAAVEAELAKLPKVQGEGGAARALRSAGATPQALDKAVTEIRKGRKVTSQNAEASFDALKKYTRDVTA